LIHAEEERRPKNILQGAIKQPERQLRDMAV